LRGILVGVVALSALLILVGQTVAIAAGQGELAAVRQATDDSHLKAACDAGYGPFYICTDDNGGAGAMGQHVRRHRRLDGKIDPLTPEALVHEPMPNGSLRLVGVEYVCQGRVGREPREPASCSATRSSRSRAGNRFGLPDFYELHAWIWRPNPERHVRELGTGKVTCRGKRHPA
jgi:hypothetical protein